MAELGWLPVPWDLIKTGGSQVPSTEVPLIGSIFTPLSTMTFLLFFKLPAKLGCHKSLFPRLLFQ